MGDWTLQVKILFIIFNMVEVAQLAEHQIVVLVVAGSSPVLHPKYSL